MSFVLHEFKADIELRIDRCWNCGRWWGRERTGPGSAPCPYCTDEIRGRLMERANKLERRVNALKGALTKARKRAQKLRAEKP